MKTFNLESIKIIAKLINFIELKSVKINLCFNTKHKKAFKPIA